MENSKKNKLTSAIAIGLAAVMLIGGASYAYLEDSDGDVVNTFSTNKVEVDIDETTGEDYDIVPGTSQDKDPSVTIDNTVDSYLYVVVTDNTQGLVEYEIADGWTLLDGYDNVYYRLVGADDADKTFSILAGDQVSYSADLTNADMEAADGDVALTFSAYAIQKTPFNDPVKAYTQETVSTAAELLAALEEGTAVTLSEDMSISAADLNSVSEDVFINLDGNTLTITGTAVVADSDNAITITNGDIDYSGSNTVAFSVREGGNITLDSVTVTTENSSTATIVNVEAGIKAAEINIVDSTLESSGYYVVSTNAGSPYSGNDVVINIENSTLTVTDGLDSYNDSCGVLFNINGTLNVTDSTITGERQGMIVRQGTANITDSTIATTGEYTGGAYYLDSTWKSGNEVPMAALVAGDRSTAYPDAVVVNLSGVTLSVSDPQGLDIPQLYAAAYNDVTTTITSDTAYDDVVESTDGTTLTITVA